MYVTLVCNTVSNMCQKRCIHGCNIRNFIILLLAGSQSMHKGLNLKILLWNLISIITMLRECAV
jgi:hypothetical protein